MQITKSIKITDKNGNKVAFLSPKSDGLKDCYADTRLNGESSLEFLLPVTSEKNKYLTPECEIWANGRVYNLLKDDAVDVIRDDKNTLWAKYMANERWYSLDLDFIEPSLSNDPLSPIPSDLAVIIVGGGSNLTGGLYPTGTAAHALYAVLAGSSWSLGTCDVTGIRDLETEKVSILGLIKLIQETWGGYLVWDSINKIVHLRNANTWQNYTGFQIRYKKNLKHITRTQSNKIVTKMYCFGHDDLDIASINSGVKYLTNFSYTSREYIGTYKNQDIYDATELKEKATDELALICRPRHLYKVKVVDLRTLPEYSHEDFSLGDMADVIDPDIASDSPRPRIIRHKYNLFKPWECELDIGDPEERLIEQLKASFDTTGFIDGKFNGNGKLSGHSIEDLTISANLIQNLAITSEKINNLAINNSHIQNLTITGGKIANATITDAKISDLSADKITAGTITATISIKSPIIDGGTITGAVLRTASSGARLELSGTGITSYSSGSIKDGFVVEDSWSEICLYSGNQKSMSMLAATSNFWWNVAGREVLRYSSSAMRPQYTWDCNDASFDWIKNSSGQYYATESFVTSKGYMTQSAADSRYARANQDLLLQIYSGKLEVKYDGETYVFVPE